jgi:PAS domain-containing protein
MIAKNINRTIWSGLLFSFFLGSFAMGWIAPSSAVLILFGALTATLFFGLLFWERIATFLFPGKSNDDLFDVVLENLPIGICVFDENLNLLKWNENYLSIMEIEEKQLSTSLHLLVPTKTALLKIV